MRKFAIVTGAVLLAGLIAGPGMAGEATPVPTAGPVVGGPGGYNPPPAKKGFRYPDCFCTGSNGERVEMGQTACLRIGSQQFTARCDMSLNNPTWRRISEGCPNV